MERGLGAASGEARSSKGVEAAVVGLFRFGCDVDLFYSDIDQTMVMSRAAAERALAQADAT